MRFKINLEVKKNNDCLLPLNYQYELSAWIYNILNYGDTEFAQWLHYKGYTNDKKQFKLFTFSNLKVKDYKIHSDRMKIFSPQVSFYISFYPDESISPFINGLFKKQELSIGDKISRVNFKVISLDKQPEPEFKNSMNFRCISPIVISYADEQMHNKKADYLFPDGEKYQRIFIQNLINKYESFYRKSIKLSEDNKISLKILSRPKSRLVTIKANTPQENKIKGYLFDFTIKSPVELIKIGYYGGFGEKNSLGFGCVKII
ncbi:MAG: CRISPR-associated endoribonuclease Cas6 [Bacteroidales bacterium]